MSEVDPESQTAQREDRDADVKFAIRADDFEWEQMDWRMQGLYRWLIRSEASRG